MIGWLDLRGASRYSALSPRTLRRYLGHAEHPLPARMVGGKLVIRVADLDRWLMSFPSAHHNVDAMVDEIFQEVKKQHRPQR